MQRTALIFCLTFAAFASANAQEFSKFTFDFFGGYTVPVGSTANFAGSGWNAGGGAGVNFTPRFGAMVNLSYDSMGLNNSTVSALGIPGGQINVFHATLDPVFRPAYLAAVSDQERLRVVVDEIASLTDTSATAWHRRLGDRKA